MNRESLLHAIQREREFLQSPESLHVTLKFIGEKSEAAVEEIKKELGNMRERPSDPKIWWERLHKARIA